MIFGTYIVYKSGDDHVFLLRRLHDVIGQAIIIWSKKLNYVIDKNYSSLFPINTLEQKVLNALYRARPSCRFMDYTSFTP
jgi:hypothetical protein